MENKIYLTALLFVIAIALTSASLGDFPKGDCINIRVLANCSEVNITEITSPTNTTIINLPMQLLGGQTFNYTFCNTTELGTYTYSWNNPCTDCSEGDCGNSFVISSTGNKSGSMLYIIIVTGLGVIFLMFSLFVNEEFFVYMSGILFLIGGIFLMINGLDIMNDSNTRYLAFIYLGIGILFTLGAYIYNNYSTNKSQEEFD